MILFSVPRILFHGHETSVICRTEGWLKCPITIYAAVVQPCFGSSVGNCFSFEEIFEGSCWLLEDSIANLYQSDKRILEPETTEAAREVEESIRDINDTKPIMQCFLEVLAHIAVRKYALLDSSHCG